MPRRILEGQVVSDKMDKTVTVLVTRQFMHPMYKKFVRETKKYAAHDEKNSFGIGDQVKIEECSPISKRKTWTVITSPSEGSGRSKKVEDVKPKNVKETKKKVKAEETEKSEEKKDEKKETKAAAAKKTTKASTAKKKTTTKKTTSKKKDEK